MQRSQPDLALVYCGRARTPGFKIVWRHFVRTSVRRVQAELQAEKEAHAIVRTHLVDKKQKQEERAQAEVSEQKSQLTELTTRLGIRERQQSQDKLTLLIEAKAALSNQFKSLASDILRGEE